MTFLSKPEKDDLEERVRRLELQLELAARRELASLLALGAAHDTSNLLTVVRSALRAWPGGEDAAAREDALYAVERASSLLREVLRLAQPGPGPTSVDVNDAVLQTAPLARLLGGPHTRVDVYLRAPLPHPLLDELDLQRILLNLVLNAIQASPEESPIRIETSLEQRREDARPFVVVTVADRGQGMSAEVRRHALEALYSGRAGGTGLGLAIVRMLVAHHHGLLEIESQPMKGTTVRVCWPVVAAGSE